MKAALYAYPFLETVEEDYAEHIKNRALLSYRSTKTAEEMAITIAEDILEKQKLVWLKERVGQALDSLTDVEKTLIGIRYFGKERKRKLAKTSGQALAENGAVQRKDGQWSERKYFRVQNRLCEKLRAIFVRLGLTEEVFEREFACLELFEKIGAYIQKTNERISQSEMRWLDR